METQNITIFVHTNDNQILPALVSIHSLRANITLNDRIDVRLLHLNGTELDQRRDGQPYRAGSTKVWDHRFELSFQFLRRKVPEEMGFKGRAMVIDPDIFAVNSIDSLLAFDMEDKAIRCRYIKDGFLGDGQAYFTSGAMLLDCAKLQHWRWKEEVEALFDGSRDYFELLRLEEEDKSTIGELGENWNSLDKLTSETTFVHMTRVSTQPWRTGLRFPEGVYEPTKANPLDSAGYPQLVVEPIRFCTNHPDPRMERLFFDLLADCLNDGNILESFVLNEIRDGRLRPDALELLTRSGYKPNENGAGQGARLMEEFNVPCP